MSLGGEAGRRRRPLWSPDGDGLGELVEARRVLGHPRVVDEAVADEHMHHRQHHRDVGARAGLEEPVGGLGGGGTDRVDHDDRGAVGAGLLDGRPQVAVGELGVRRPQDDQLGVADLERIHAEPGAVSHRHTGADGRPTDRAHEPARTEVVEEPATDALQGEDALVAGVAERQDRLGAVGVDHVVQPGRDLAERVVPRDAARTRRCPSVRCAGADAGCGRGCRHGRGSD